MAGGLLIRRVVALRDRLTRVDPGQLLRCAQKQFQVWFLGQPQRWGIGQPPMVLAQRERLEMRDAAQQKINGLHDGLSGQPCDAFRFALVILLRPDATFLCVCENALNLVRQIPELVPQMLDSGNIRRGTKLDKNQRLISPRIAIGPVVEIREFCFDSKLLRRDLNMRSDGEKSVVEIVLYGPSLSHPLRFFEYNFLESNVERIGGEAWPRQRPRA